MKLSIVIVNYNVELILTDQNQIGKLQGVDTEIGRQLCVKRDAAFVNAQFLYQQIFYLLKHEKSS